ncbi:hypothetical protein M569_17396 [Genlisea aurea]|uniref:Purple acid phosphatase Fn3-like domain-containing protein n=1 Tax=Genlisea aurea TaxID=192259 RepID=S8DDL4_9LAMI|nr:hypothetical protein M569_17396 [Genlisea aurea]
MKLSTSGRFLSPITILLLVGLIDFSLSRPDHRRLTTTNQNSVKIEIVSDDGKELPDNGYITVKVSGVAVPSDSDWVGLMTPSTANSKNIYLVH